MNIFPQQIKQAVLRLAMIPEHCLKLEICSKVKWHETVVCLNTVKKLNNVFLFQLKFLPQNHRVPLPSFKCFN